MDLMDDPLLLVKEYPDGGFYSWTCPLCLNTTTESSLTQLMWTADRHIRNAWDWCVKWVPWR